MRQEDFERQSRVCLKTGNVNKKETSKVCDAYSDGFDDQVVQGSTIFNLHNVACDIIKESFDHRLTTTRHCRYKFEGLICKPWKLLPSSVEWCSWKSQQSASQDDFLHCCRTLRRQHQHLVCSLAMCFQSLRERCVKGNLRTSWTTESWINAPIHVLQHKVFELSRGGA
jgi:hypothetical protein